MRRLFPVLEEEFHTSILPAILNMQFTAKENELVFKMAKEALPKMWDLYFREKAVEELGALLRKPATRIYWQETLTLHLLPLIQNKLLPAPF